MGSFDMDRATQRVSELDVGRQPERIRDRGELDRGHRLLREGRWRDQQQPSDQPMPHDILPERSFVLLTLKRMLVYRYSRRPSPAGVSPVISVRRPAHGAAREGMICWCVF